MAIKLYMAWDSYKFKDENHKSAIGMAAMTGWRTVTALRKMRNSVLMSVIHTAADTEHMRLMRDGLRAWIGFIQEIKTARVLAVLNYYEGDIRPLVMPLLSNRAATVIMDWSKLNDEADASRLCAVNKITQSNTTTNTPPFRVIESSTVSPGKRASQLRQILPKEKLYTKQRNGTSNAATRGPQFTVQDVARMTVHEGMISSGMQRVNRIIKEYIGVDAATGLLMKTNGNVNHATHYVYKGEHLQYDRVHINAMNTHRCVNPGVSEAVALAHYVGNALSSAFEAYRDFIYMWKAWKAMYERSCWLPVGGVKTIICCPTLELTLSCLIGKALLCALG